MMIRKFILELQNDIHAIAVEKGWWEEDRSLGDIFTLVNTEFSECYEHYRDGDLDAPSDKIPAFSHHEEEISDAIIRLLDHAGKHGLDIEGAMAAKIVYNTTRPHRHGEKLA